MTLCNFRASGQLRLVATAPQPESHLFSRPGDSALEKPTRKAWNGNGMGLGG